MYPVKGGVVCKEMGLYLDPVIKDPFMSEPP